jgi:hypothetical protein
MVICGTPQAANKDVKPSLSRELSPGQDFRKDGGVQLDHRSTQL